MNGLENIQSSYIILSADRLNEMISVLYSKEYQILPIQSYYKGNFEDSVKTKKIMRCAFEIK